MAAGVLLGVTACGGGGGADSSFGSDAGPGPNLSRLSVAEINDTLAENGLTGTGTHQVLKDGLDSNGTGRVDINQVFLTRVSGNVFSNDIGFAFDMLNREASDDPFDAATPVLYLDTDLNASTGMPIKGIGADVRLAHQQPADLTSGYALWQAQGAVWQPVLTFVSRQLLTEVNGGYHVIVVVDGTSGLLSSTQTYGVLAMDVLGSDQSTVQQRYDSTRLFTIAPF
jgi:hypothetical protein